MKKSYEKDGSILYSPLSSFQEHYIPPHGANQVVPAVRNDFLFHIPIVPLLIVGAKGLRDIVAFN